MSDQLSIDSMTSDKVCKLNMPKQAAPNKRPHFCIDWRQLTYFYRERSGSPWSACFRSHSTGSNWSQSKKMILNSLDGCFKSGQLSAILGPSGAGKSTFLSALFGNKQESAYGQTRVTWFEDSKHQKPIDLRIKQRPIRIAFLPQHDHLLNHLSVYETLMFASKIKNAARLKEMNLKAKDRQLFHRQNVKRVAKMLKLVECLQTRCARLSGGQYKRVSIGQELLSEPDVIILDEPTSGLDAMTCLTTVKTLKSIAMRQPISIILTIHQPDVDVFNLFNHVYVIAQGGCAIYEGPPSGVVATLARVNLHMPTIGYNPARFIVENAFIAPIESGENVAQKAGQPNGISVFSSDEEEEEEEEEDEDEEDGEIFQETKEDFINSDREDEDEVNNQNAYTKEVNKGEIQNNGANIITRSLLSLTGSSSSLKQTFINLNPIGIKPLRESGRRPLLNIGGVRTSDGKLITSNQLAFNDKSNKWQQDYEREKEKRFSLLKLLNDIQKAKYYSQPIVSSKQINSEQSTSNSDTSSEISNSSASSSNEQRPSSVNSSSSSPLSNNDICESIITNHEQVNKSEEDSSNNFIMNINNAEHKTSFLNDKGANNNTNNNNINFSKVSTKTSGVGSTISYSASCPTSKSNSLRTTSGLSTFSGNSLKLKRHFDKRLSAKHSNSKHRDYPIYYHSYLLTHRTWLSIVRDPVFFGIQFCMHTTIPILLALIFGSQQDEGCPRLGQFDLVDFAYQPDSNNFIRETMQSIRQSIGNIGVIFFEMFVLSFAINCITALVFPLDMFVLLKEYRNGWYSLRSYFIGRTLADLPVPIVLHSMAMCILYYMTGQPNEWWRFGAIIVIVIIASLVAQSIGLTIGALLMRSSQSAVLAAAGIVAPFFALSGFIVRIHTLPWVAQWAAQGSYLYHLLNGFIVMRYGFGRCPCETGDFSESDQHKIPHNLRTMASIWIGTYSNEYTSAAENHTLIDRANETRSNVDPNIDLVDKLSSAFKMANSYGHKVDSCDEALPYAMLDFNLRDNDIWACCTALLVMLLVTRLITFASIYYKIRSFA